MIAPARLAAFLELTGRRSELDQLQKEDRRLSERIVLSTGQNERFLDFCISRFATTPLSRMHPDVLWILRLSACQLLFFERIPASAAVNDAVALCRKKKASYAAGFVNAVLRRISEHREELFSQELDPAVRYSHPDWLEELLFSQIGEEETLAFFRANQEIPGLCVQVNTLRCSLKDYCSLLERAGIRILSVNPDFSSLQLSGTAVEKLPGYEEGMFYIQDDASRTAVRLAEIRPGQQVLDVCAAPGGKSMAAVLDGAGSVTSCDVSPSRLERCRENFSRLKFEIPVICADAAVFRPSLEGAFDTVLADVPCSGTGVIRRHPEIRKKERSELTVLLPIQSSILDNVSRYVTSGGVLLYSTCSVLREEDEAQTEAFLIRHPEFSLVAEMRSWPQNSGNDGFYAAKMRRH